MVDGDESCCGTIASIVSNRAATAKIMDTNDIRDAVYAGDDV